MDRLKFNVNGVFFFLIRSVKRRKKKKKRKDKEKTDWGIGNCENK